jgi:hypothetical protein
MSQVCYGHLDFFCHTGHIASFPLPSPLRHRLTRPRFASAMNEYTSVHQEHLISPDGAAQVILAAFMNPAAVPLACINVLTYSYGVLLETIKRSSALPLVERSFGATKTCFLPPCSFSAASALQSTFVFSSKHSSVGLAGVRRDRR